MILKPLALSTAVLLALGSSSFAAGTTKQHDAGGIAASKAGTEIEKAVGAGDTFTKAELNSAMSLSKVSDAKDKLATAKVDDPSGNIIGPVKSVMTDKAGKASAIHVDVGGWLGLGEHVVSMNAKNFTYLPDRNILLTKMTKEQVKKMKPIKENG